MNTDWQTAAILVVISSLAYGGGRAYVDSARVRPAMTAELEAATGGVCYICDHNSVNCPDVNCTQGGGGGSWYVDGSNRTTEPYCKTVSDGYEDCLDGSPRYCTKHYECEDLGCQQGCQLINTADVDSACYGTNPCGG